MTPILDALRSLPLAAHGLVVVALVGGVVLWLFGRAVFKPAAVVLFAALGGTAGLLAVTLTGLGDQVGVLAGVGAGMVLGAIAGALLFRFAMAAGFALVLGFASPLAAAVLMEAAWPETGDGWDTNASNGSLALEDQYLRGVDRYDEMAKRLRESAVPAAEEAAKSDDPETRRRAAAEAATTAAGEVREFLGAVADEARYRWGGLPGREKMVIGIGAVGGAALGFLLGLAMPGWAAGAASAMIGSLLMLLSGVWLLRAMNSPGQESIDSLSARGWLIAWGSLSVVGMVVQWRKGRRGGGSDQVESGDA